MIYIPSNQKVRERVKTALEFYLLLDLEPGDALCANVYLVSEPIYEQCTFVAYHDVGGRLHESGLCYDFGGIDPRKAVGALVSVKFNDARERSYPIMSFKVIRDPLTQSWHQKH